MPSVQHNGSLRRTFLRGFILLVPALVVGVTMLSTTSCRYENSGGDGPATATATSTAGTLAFVTNYNDGKVSSFTRNTTTGVLKRTGQVTAGAKKGPKGLVAAPSGSFLYVANHADDNIYEFSVNSTNGVLTPLGTASISNGSGSGPDEIAINPAGSFLFVTGFKDGSVTTYSINSGTGELTQESKVTGLNNPWGIAADSTGSYVYVMDNGAGTVFAFAINSTSGKLSQIGSSVFDLGSPGGAPAFIAIDPAATYIYVTDETAGVLSVLGTSSGALSFGSIVPSTTTDTGPIGIAYASVDTVGNYVFTANQGNSSLWSFLISSPGFPAQPVEFGSGNLNAPTGVVVDPQNAFLYTTNQNAGTVSQFELTPACFAAGAPCFVGSVSTESPHNASSGPFGITLAQ